MTIEVDSPTLRPDRAGYVLGADVVDGFADRPELSIAHREIIARFAHEFAPADLSTAQRRLLDGVATPEPSPLLRQLTQNADDLDEGFVFGFEDRLTEDQRQLVRDPGAHPALSGRTYPLSIGQVEKLTGATQRQLRYWEEIGLLPAHRVQEGRRSYFSAAIVRAFALVQLGPRTIETLGVIASGGNDAAQLLGLIGATLAATRQQALIDTGKQLVATAPAVREMAPA